MTERNGPSGLKGRVALITGSSRGIGAGIARVLANDGADIFINYSSDKTGADEVARSVRAAGRRAWPIQADVREPSEIKYLFERIERETGFLDIFVNNAVEPIAKTAMQLTVDEWDRSMNVAARALLICAQRAVPLMTDRDGAAIIHVSSRGAATGGGSYCALGVAKAAAESLVRYLAADLADAGINVNTVRAGSVDTAAARTMRGGVAPTPVDDHPLHRLSEPEDVGRVVAFLCTPAAAWIRGQIIDASGNT